MFAAESISGHIIRRNAFWLFVKLFVIASTSRRVFGLNAHIPWTGAIANCGHNALQRLLSVLIASAAVIASLPPTATSSNFAPTGTDLSP